MVVSYRFVAMAMLMAVPLWPVVLHADTDEEFARAAFDTATKLYQQQDYEAAAQKFREAYTRKESWKILFNIGQSEAAAKHYGIALETFEQYLAEAGDEIGAERKNEVLEELRKLRDMVGDLQVDGPQGAAVEVDGIERGRLPLLSTIAVSAGIPHEVTVRLAETVLLRQEIRVRSTQRVHLEVSEAGAQSAAAVPVLPSGASNGTPDSASPSEEDTESMVKSPGENAAVDDKDNNSLKINESDDSQRAEMQAATPEEVGSTAETKTRSSAVLRPVGLGLILGGGAALLAGVVTGSVAVARKNRLEEICDQNVCIGPNAKNLDTERRHLATASDILFVSGLVLSGTGAALMLVARHRKSESLSAVSPFVTRDAGGILLARSF